MVTCYQVQFIQKLFKGIVRRFLLEKRKKKINIIRILKKVDFVPTNLKYKCRSLASRVKFFPLDAPQKF